MDQSCLPHCFNAIHCCFQTNEWAAANSSSRNLLGAAGMAIAIVAACFEQPIAASIASHGIWPLLLVLFAAIGGGIGATMAIRWPMTEMPQMVALLNGFGMLLQCSLLLQN